MCVCVCITEWKTERIMWRYLFFSFLYIFTFSLPLSFDRAHNHYSHRHPIIWKMRKSNEKVLNNKSQEIVSKIFSIWIWIKFKWTTPFDRSMEFCLAFQTIYQCPKWCVLLYIHISILLTTTQKKRNKTTGYVLYQMCGLVGLLVRACVRMSTRFILYIQN